MSDRIQFNVRLDKYPDLYEAFRAKAEEEGLTLNELAIRAFQQILGWEVKDASPTPMVPRTELEELVAEMLAPMQRRLEEIEQQQRLGKSAA
jgi:hypothetical protein